MRKHPTGRELEDASEPYIDQGAWLARIVARICLGFAIAVSAVAVLVTSAMADSGFNFFEIVIVAALIIAAVVLVALSVWLGMKARTLASGLEHYLNEKRKRGK